MTVGKRSEKSEELVARGDKGWALMGGTHEMREKGRTYLPQFEAESDANYSVRKKISWLFNGYRKTVRDMTGRIFDQPIRPGKDVPPRVLSYLENVDLMGNDLSVFAASVFSDALAGPGISFIMVDSPRREGVVTVAQANSLNLRPYLTHLSAEDILGWHTEIIDNTPTLTQIRIAESIVEADPKDEFAQIEVDQIRVIDRTDQGAAFRLYRKNSKDKWVLFSGPYLTGLRDITVVPLVLGPDDFFMGEPVLEDLADINIAHWQSQSDQRNLLHVARVPVMFVRGIAPDEPIELSVSSIIRTSDPSADVKWVEAAGKAMGEGWTDLARLEFQMEAMGLQLITGKTATQSATGAAIDAVKETSTLSKTADALKDALENVLAYMAEYSGESTGGSVIVNKEFTVAPIDARENTMLLSAVNTGQISQELFLRTMVERGALPEDTDIEAELVAQANSSGGLMQ